MHNGKANSGPLDFASLLKRRRSSYDRYFDSEGVTTRQQLLAKIAEVESTGEYFVSEEMREAGLARFPEPQEAPQNPPADETAPVALTSPPDPVKAPEEPTPRKKRSKAV